MATEKRLITRVDGVQQHYTVGSDAVPRPEAPLLVASDLVPSPMATAARVAVAREMLMPPSTPSRDSWDMDVFDPQFASLFAFDAHDFDPRGDYDVRPDHFTHPLLAVAQQRAQFLADLPDTPFTAAHVFPADLSERPGDVAVYCFGTSSEPVFLVDIDKHLADAVDPVDEIRRSVDHELAHAIQEYHADLAGDPFVVHSDEHDAEHHGFPPEPTGSDRVALDEEGFLVEHPQFTGLWNNPEWMAGRCEEVSTAYVRHLTAVDPDRSVMLLDGHRDGFGAHSVVVVDGSTVVDWTARQFHPDVDLPIIQPLAQWSAVWQPNRAPYAPDIDEDEDEWLSWSMDDAGSDGL